ncbi:caspase, EACC1-associated type [Embleya sp. MST-111070]|uniref:caspase, EACC1-associated type n=1 Tax=Embleya sp. MST-111070 TaxID=3398231 RepID=UPI003F74119D
MTVPDPAASRAVLVGVHAYTRLDPLPPVVAGVTRLAGLLCDPTVWGLPADHVTVLGSDASRDTILSSVRDAARECTDTLLVYFAGHGLRDRNGEQLRLALADADDEHPEIGTLDYTSLRRVVNRVGGRARRRITVLDCCYSGLAGGMGAPPALTRPHLARLLERDDLDDAEDHGSCVLTSAPGTGRSFAPPGGEYPEFTGALIDILDNGVEGAGPALTPYLVWRLVRHRLRAQGSPEPQQFGHNAVVRHDWVRNRAHHRTTGRPETPDAPVKGASRKTRSDRSAFLTPPPSRPPRSSGLPFSVAVPPPSTRKAGELATLGRRSVALLTDVVMLVVMFFAVAEFFRSVGFLDDLGIREGLVVGLASWLLVATGPELFTGASYGKLLCRLRTVDYQGTRLTLPRKFARAALRLLVGAPATLTVLGVILIVRLAIDDTHNRCPWDRATESMVIFLPR